MSTRIWGLNPNPAYTGAVGDIFIRTTTNEQLRWDGAAWQPLVPPETRGDVVPPGGILNDRLGKNHSRPFDLKWMNAAEGITMVHDQTTPAAQWIIAHMLSARFVDVTVLRPGNASP